MIVYICYVGLDYKISISVFYLSSSIIVFDIILGILNGTGDASKYSQLSLFRAFGAFVFPVLVATAGGDGVQVAVASATAVVLSMVVCNAARSPFGSISSPKNVIAGMKRYLKFGFGGALVLGVYVLINAPIRNLIAHFEGIDVAGHWALTSDVFYGPLAIAGTVATLSANRQLHRWSLRGPEVKEKDASTAYFQSLLLVSVPYAAVGYLVAADIAPLIFSHEIAAELAALAPQICIQNAAILIMYGLAYVAFTKERWRALYISVVLMTVFPLVAAAIALMEVLPWFDVVDAVTLSIAVCTLLITSSFAFLEIIKIDLVNLFKIISLTVIVIMAIIMIRSIYISAEMTLFASIIGGVVYLAGAQFLGMLQVDLNSQTES